MIWGQSPYANRQGRGLLWMMLLSVHSCHRMPKSITLTGIHITMNSRAYAVCLTLYSMIVHYNTLTTVNMDDKKFPLNCHWFLFMAHVSFISVLPQLFQSLRFNDFMKSLPHCLWGGPIFLMGEVYLNCLRDVFVLPACCPRICETRNSIKNSLNLLANIHSLSRNNFD